MSEPKSIYDFAVFDVATGYESSLDKRDTKRRKRLATVQHILCEKVKQNQAEIARRVEARPVASSQPALQFTNLIDAPTEICFRLLKGVRSQNPSENLQRKSAVADLALEASDLFIGLLYDYRIIPSGFSGLFFTWFVLPLLKELVLALFMWLIERSIEADRSFGGRSRGVSVSPDEMDDRAAILAMFARMSNLV